MPFLRRKRPQEEAEIPTASMADIAFLLIIFFMTTSIFARDKGLKLVLPEKGTEVKVKTTHLMKISINDKGEIFVGDQPTSLPELRPQIEQRLASDTMLVIYIKTHQDAPYERMIEVFDLVKTIPDAKRVSLGIIRPGGSP